MQHSATQWTTALLVYGIAVLATTIPAVLFAAKRRNPQANQSANQSANQKLMIWVSVLDTIYLMLLLGYRFLFM